MEKNFKTPHKNKVDVVAKMQQFLVLLTSVVFLSLLKLLLPALYTLLRPLADSDMRDVTKRGHRAKPEQQGACRCDNWTLACRAKEFSPENFL